MKSVGEVLALGRTFGEAFGKAMAGRELDVSPRAPADVDEALDMLRTPSWDRYDLILWALDRGVRRAERRTRPPASTRGSWASSAALAAARAAGRAARSTPLDAARPARAPAARA